MADFVVPGSPAVRALLAVKKKKPARKKKPPDPPQATPTPGTIDDTTGFVNLAPPPPSGKGSRKRDFAAQIRAEYATVDDMAAATQAFDKLHLKPITISTQTNHRIARRLWVEWFTMLYKSPQKAEETLLPKAPFPPVAEVKQFLCFLSTKGLSGLGVPGIIGWSVHTTRTFAGRVFALLRRANTTPPTLGDRDQIYAAISTWSFEEKILTSLKKIKRLVRECDFLEFMTAVFNRKVTIGTNFMRLQIAGLSGVMYTHGFRPGSVVDAKGYEGMKEHVKWEDTEWLAYGWDKGAGLGLQSFWTMRWIKGMRFDDSLTVSTNMRNLGRSRIHLDPQLIIEALAIESDIFEQDLLALRAADPTTLSFPIKLTFKPGKGQLPMFRNADRNDGLTLNSASHLLNKVKKVLGWSNFSFVTFRYSYASSMVNKVSKTHLRYLMGHTISSNLSVTTYQAPDRPIDVSGVMFGEEGMLFAAAAQEHSSVAWNRPPPPSDETLYNDPIMKDMVKECARREERVRIKYPGRTSEELLEAGEEDPIIAEAIEMKAETLEYYLSLSTGSHARIVTRAAVAPSSSSSSSTSAPTSSSSSTFTATSSSSSSTSTPAADENALNLYESMMDAWATTDAVHPLLPLIESDKNNPRLAVLQRYVAMLHLDHEHRPGLCLWCYTDPSLSEEDQNKDHSAHYVQHVSSCELKHNPDHWRCPICVQLVPVVPKRSGAYKTRRNKARKKSGEDPDTDDELPVISMPSMVITEDDEMDKEVRIGIHDAFVEHCEACFERLGALVRRDAVEADDEETETETETESALPRPSIGRRSRATPSVGKPNSKASATSDVDMGGSDSDVSMASVRSHTSIIRSTQKRNKDTYDGEE
ncbi:hypothetical protein DFH06DRAFT_1145565 [Mycena polygramma]|nr:hypothetical protein DFH06DRAFT_1145565 [Mycena polygramma]